ncbi:MAG: hypothetical protein P1P69_00475 [Methanosarcinaceae archaeon]|nr:hypothetical protein [Methanosarcinaceae archaeon]
MIENVFEYINNNLVLPIVLITFLLLTYIEYNFVRKDPDMVKAKIFLRYNILKKAFLLLAFFSFALLLHVVLISHPHILDFMFQYSLSFIYELQRILGLILVIILIYFVALIYKVIK